MIEILVGAVVVWALNIIVPALLAPKKSNIPHGPAYGRDPGGRLQYGTNTPQAPAREHFGEQSGDPIPNYRSCPMCTPARNTITGTPDMRLNEMMAAQSTRQTRREALPAPKKALPEPLVAPSIFDAMRQRDGSYRVSDIGKE